jgi:hypothetical protein
MDPRIRIRIRIHTKMSWICMQHWFLSSCTGFSTSYVPYLSRQSCISYLITGNSLRIHFRTSINQKNPPAVQKKNHQLLQDGIFLFPPSCESKTLIPLLEICTLIDKQVDSFLKRDKISTPYEWQKQQENVNKYNSLQSL